jgi:hypothetical protein
MKSDIGANLDDNIARPNETILELRLDTAVFPVIGYGLPDVNIVDIHEEIIVASRHDDDAVVKNEFLRQYSVSSQSDATTVSPESYQMLPP